MAQGKIHVRKGDKVLILSGKEKGKKAKVISTLPREGKVLVEGINIVKKHSRPTRSMPQGGIREIEAPINASKVMLVCPSCQRPTRVAKKIMSDGERARSCKRCQETIG